MTNVMFTSYYRSMSTGILAISTLSTYVIAQTLRMQPRSDSNTSDIAEDNFAQ